MSKTKKKKTSKRPKASPKLAQAKSKTPKSKKVAKPRRLPKRLSHTLYAYVEPINGKHAREFGKKHFGSFSAYLDVLVNMDRREQLTKGLVADLAKAPKKVAKKARKKAAKKASKPKKKAKASGAVVRLKKAKPAAETAPVATEAQAA